MKKFSRIASISFIVMMMLATYIPILMIVVFSFTKSKAFGDWQNYKFSLELFVDLFNSTEIMEALRNSIVIGLVSSLLATIIGTFSAIGLFYCKKKVRSVLEYSGQITMFNADIVTALAMLVFFIFLKLENDYIRLIIAHTVICLPYVVMSIMPRMYQLSPNVYEAGIDLGATPSRTLFTVILPQLVGGMVAGFALAFTISIDDFTISKFVSDNVTTIPIFLYDSLRTKGIVAEVRALSTLLLVAILLILVFINVYSVRRQKKLKKISSPI